MKPFQKSFELISFKTNDLDISKRSGGVIKVSLSFFFVANKLINIAINKFLWVISIQKLFSDFKNSTSQNTSNTCSAI